MSAMVAALYVERGGVYWNLPGVDPWDEARDARTYPGPWPVVAHPPCNRWCKPLAFLNEARYGHKVGDDGGTFAAALEAVRLWGGILEHPAHSAAWDTFGLPRPGRDGWAQSIDAPGFATEIDQHPYGHPCRKTTWLYYVGCSPPDLLWTRAPDGLPVISLLYGAEKLRRTGRHVVRHAAASATPPALAAVLVDAARAAMITHETSGGPAPRETAGRDRPRGITPRATPASETGTDGCEARTGNGWQASGPLSV